MMPRNWLVQPTVLFVLLLSGLSCADEQTGSDKALPSQIVPEMLSKLVENPRQPRDELLAPFLARIKTNDLAPKEHFLLGEAYFIAADPLKALPYFEAAKSSNADYGRQAWQRIIIIEHNANDAYEKAGKLLAEYRARFSPAPNDLWGLYQPIISMAARQRKTENHAEVVKIVLAELESLGDDAPYQSLQLPAMFFASFESAGQREVAMEILTKARDSVAQHATKPLASQSLVDCLQMEDIISLSGGSYRIGEEVRCDVAFRQANLLTALESTLEERREK